MRTHYIAATVAALALTATSAQAAELVTNGGFETGNTSGWTQGGNLGFTGVATIGAPITTYDGTYSFFAGPVGSIGSLSQILSTVAGQAYTFSFAWAHGGGTPNSFSVNIGSFSQAYTNFPTNFPWTLVTGGFTATSASTALTFTFQHNPDYWYIDNVSVQGAVPEPATWAMLILGFGAIGAGMRRRERTRVIYA